MSSSDNQQHNHSQSQCPECKKKYVSSSSSSQDNSEENQRIIIPLRKDLLTATQNTETQSILKSLQSEIQSLKQTNIQKDRMIEDLKKQIEHKMTHYMIYGQINKQADEINKLKCQISCGTNPKNSRRVEINQDQIRSIFRDESRRFVENKLGGNKRNYSHQMEPRHKTFSTYDNYITLKKQLLSPKKQRLKHRQNNQRSDHQNKNAQQNINNEYFSRENHRTIFKIGDAKKKIAELQEKIRFYEQQMVWMSNFVSTFIKTMQNLAYKKHQEQIIIPEWTLKKKAKTSWRYMKHLFKFLYSDSQQPN